MELIRLNSKKVADLWQAIRGTVFKKMPPVASVGVLSKVAMLRALIAGDIRFWLASEDRDIVGYIMTTVTKDVCTFNRNLLVYSFDFNRYLTAEEVKYIGHIMLDYAKVQGCTSISTFTDNEKIIEHVKKFKSASITQYIRLEVGDE